MMKLSIAIFLAIFSLSSEAFLSTSDKGYSLTHNERKFWSLSHTSPSYLDCQEAESVSSDNVYIFFSDGTFQFDNGTITEDSACEECCTDLVDLVGRWEFTNRESGIRVTILHEKGNTSNAQSMVLFDARIDTLTEDALTISQTDAATGVVYKFEFKKT